MELYCVLRKAEFDSDFGNIMIDDYIDVDCYDSLEKAKKALNELYEQDRQCNEDEELVVNALRKDGQSYYVEIVSEKMFIKHCKITCKILFKTVL